MEAGRTGGWEDVNEYLAVGSIDIIVYVRTR